MKSVDSSSANRWPTTEGLRPIRERPDPLLGVFLDARPLGFGKERFNRHTVELCVPRCSFGLILCPREESLVTDKYPTQKDTRDRLIHEISDGVTEAAAVSFSDKSILARGCDPEMARRASQMLPPLLGHPELVSCTDDDDFVARLKARTWSVVFFAPGACRYHAAKMPIPGGRPKTRGWSLKQYRALVREHQGEHVPIVETTEERDIIPLLRRALRDSATGDPHDPGAD